MTTHSVNTISTDVGFKIPKNYFRKIYPHSNYTLKFTDVGTGVIDSDYRGKVSDVFFNFSDKFYQMSVGDIIAQVIFQRISISDLEEVSEFNNETERGQRGFGSMNLSATVLSSVVSTQMCCLIKNA